MSSREIEISIEQQIFIEKYEIYSKSPILKEWFSDEKEAIQHLLSPRSISSKNLSNLSVHENARNVMASFSPQDVAKLQELVPTELIYRYPAPAREVLGYFESRLEDQQDWQATLVYLDSFARKTGRYDVDPTFLRESLVSSTEIDSGASLGQKKEKEVSFINGAKSSRYYFKAQRILADNGFSDDHKKGHEGWKNYVESFDLNAVEDPKHPLAHLKGTIGIEIEHRLSSEINANEITLLSNLGIDLDEGGNGYSEFSPGVFRNYKAMDLLIRKLIDYDYIDVDRESGQSIHFDIGVEYLDGAIEFTRAIQGSGYLFSPLYEYSGNEKYETRILYKNNKSKVPGEGYLDIKEFALLSPEAFSEGLPSVFALNSSLRAYQKALLAMINGEARRPTYANSPIKIRLDEQRHAITKKDILSLDNITIEQKNLALLYSHFVSDIHSVYAQRDMSSFLEKLSDRKDALRFANELKEVLPNRWSYYDVDPSMVNVGSEIVSGFNGERRYRNIVDYSRQQCSEMTKYVNIILATGQKRFERILAFCATLDKNHRDQIKAVEFLIKNFPSGVPNNAGVEEKMQRFKELREKYL